MVPFLSCFFDSTWYPISEWKGIIADEITRLTGVDMDLTIAVDGQQLGLLIASGDLEAHLFPPGIWGGQRLQLFYRAGESVGMNELEAFMDPRIKDAMKVYGVA